MPQLDVAAQEYQADLVLRQRGFSGADAVLELLLMSVVRYRLNRHSEWCAVGWAGMRVLTHEKLRAFVIHVMLMRDAPLLALTQLSPYALALGSA